MASLRSRKTAARLASLRSRKTPARLASLRSRKTPARLASLRSRKTPARLASLRSRKTPASLASLRSRRTAAGLASLRSRKMPARLASLRSRRSSPNAVSVADSLVRSAAPTALGRRTSMRNLLTPSPAQIRICPRKLSCSHFIRGALSGKEKVDLALADLGWHGLRDRAREPCSLTPRAPRSQECQEGLRWLGPSLLGTFGFLALLAQIKTLTLSIRRIGQDDWHQLILGAPDELPKDVSSTRPPRPQRFDCTPPQACLKLPPCPSPWFDRLQHL